MIIFEGKDHRCSLEEREAYILQLRQESKFRDDAYVFLFTCDRTEVYYGDGALEEETVKHLYRVVSGLDSPLVGETAIQGQVKRAYEQAKEKRNLPGGFHRLFQRALRVGKRVRTETALSSGAMSHAFAAMEMLKRLGLDLSGAKVIVLGVNKISRDVVRYLSSCGSETVLISNRTYEKALEMTHEVGGRALRCDSLYDELRNAEVLISATGAPHFLVKKDKFRVEKEIVVIDLAVPRDIDPDVGALEGVRLFNISDVEALIENNIERRKGEVEKAEAIIEEEVKKLCVRGEVICA